MPEKKKASTQDAPRPLKCPICGKPSAHLAPAGGGPTPFPFCSDRCKLRDLGRWLDGSYQVPVEDDDLDESIQTIDDPSS